MIKRSSQQLTLETSVLSSNRNSHINWTHSNRIKAECQRHLAKFSISNEYMHATKYVAQRKKQYKIFNHPGVHHIWYHLLSKEWGLKLFSKNNQVKNNSSKSGRHQEAQCTIPPFNTNTLLLTESIWNVKGYGALPPRASLWTVCQITESAFIFSLLFLSPLPSLRF